MEDPPGSSSSKYHHLLRHKPSHIVNIHVINYISSIREDERIERLENNQWKSLWYKVIFQGINATKALARIIGTKYMHINICRSSIYQAHLSIYKYLQKIKSAKKVILNDYSQKNISSISGLQDKSSKVDPL